MRPEFCKIVTYPGGGNRIRTVGPLCRAATGGRSEAFSTRNDGPRRSVTSQSPTPAELFAEGKIDACLGLPPVPQDLRARHIGHVVVNSAMDRPWSQYFCCMLAGNREFVRKYPVATKRVLRAILKGVDFCAGEPARAARRLIDGKFTARYDYALQTMRDVPYDKWREYDAEDTIRYYALRLHELGFVKSSPQKIIADATDWRYLDELKRELKT
jgi:NitT/TauT family transport system substrate-binding protein